jgi:hypothetical protein
MLSSKHSSKIGGAVSESKKDGALRKSAGNFTAGLVSTTCLTVVCDSSPATLANSFIGYPLGKAATVLAFGLLS